ncbi:hypothetical protein Pcinc_041726 [Petrolisthes cinctipes]|uniref:Uncharacterized protein n=1 Tax=Petrolisthes cinctipes TaxID=88211 RepID=A0AAE1EHI9_PETCI|nr:hypothetical protein Pcinc_041726 [Petrolisthes cinctipes]
MRQRETGREQGKAGQGIGNYTGIPLASQPSSHATHSIPLTASHSPSHSQHPTPHPTHSIPLPIPLTASHQPVSQSGISITSFSPSRKTSPKLISQLR